jgi:hypothetical protein
MAVRHGLQQHYPVSDRARAGLPTFSEIRGAQHDGQKTSELKPIDSAPHQRCPVSDRVRAKLTPLSFPARETPLAGHRERPATTQRQGRVDQGLQAVLNRQCRKTGHKSATRNDLGWP